MRRLIAFLALVPTAVHAQVAPATELPAPLVTALIARLSGAPSYYVGTLPPGWPSSVVIPRDAHVVGGMKSGRELVAVFEDTMPHALAAFDSTFETSGFTHPPSPPMPGFQSTQVRSGYCRDSAFVTATTVPGMGGHPYVYVRFLMPGGASSCTTPTPLRGPNTSLELPLLQPPPGATTPGGGFGGGSDDVNASTTLIAPALSGGQVLEHYARQLVSAGWTAWPSAVTERGAIQPFDARDAKGDAWSGALVVVTRGNVRDASLFMRRVKS